MKYLTVKEVSNVLNITERAVQKKFEKYEKELNQYLKREKNKYLFEQDGIEKLRNIGLKKKNIKKSDTNETNYILRSFVDSLIKDKEILELEKKELKAEIMEKKEKIKSLEIELQELKKYNDLPFWSKLLNFKKRVKN